MNFTLCADDFGQTSEICEGILTLVEHARISAVSCMSNCTAWSTYAKALLKYKDRIDIGLHVNLDTLLGDDPTTIFDLAYAILVGKLTHNDIINAFFTQYHQFVEEIGRAPDFIDGHQHIHQFPIVAKAILSGYLQYFPNKDPYFRLATLSFDHTVCYHALTKKIIISLLGNFFLKGQLKKLGISHNDYFAGIYNFNHAPFYRKHFLNFIDGIRPNTLIMCHPGFVTNDSNDPLQQFILLEYEYLMINCFFELIRLKKIIIHFAIFILSY